MARLLNQEEKVSLAFSEREAEIIQNADIEKGKELTRNFFVRFLNKKTCFCKHKYGCILNAVIGFTKNLALGYGIKTLIQIMVFLIRRKKLVKLKGALFNYDSLLFALFLALLSGMYKSMNCLLRSVRKTEDAKNSIYSGLFSSLSAIVDKVDSRQTNILYLFSRNIDFTIALLKNRGIISEWRFWSVWVYTLVSTTILYLTYFETEISPKFANKNINFFGALKKNDIIYKDIICNSMLQILQK